MDCCLKAGHRLYSNSENITFSNVLKQLAALEVLPCAHLLWFYLWTNSIGSKSDFQGYFYTGFWMAMLMLAGNCFFLFQVRRGKHLKPELNSISRRRPVHIWQQYALYFRITFTVPPWHFFRGWKNKDKVLGECKQKLQTTKNTQAGLCEPPAPFSEFHAWIYYSK